MYKTNNMKNKSPIVLPSVSNFYMKKSKNLPYLSLNIFNYTTGIIISNNSMPVTGKLTFLW